MTETARLIVPRKADGAVAAFAGSARRWARLAADGRLEWPTERIGMRLHFADGTTSFVFRETALAGARTDEPVLLVIQFRLAFLGSSPLLHTAFRRECILHTPLFAGFAGFRSKLWADDVATGVYRGIYQWNGADAARAYAGRMVGLLDPFSNAGTARSHIVEGLTRDAYLRDPALAPNDPAGGWWRLAACQRS
jgi:hypothetical protein